MAETPVTSEAPVTPAIERAKATQDSVAVVEGKQGEVKTEAKKDLVQLQQEFQTKQKSEGVNMKKHTEALKKTEYQKQVGYILGMESTDPVVLKQGIKDLQKALGFKDKAADGALGPNTFKELKVRWEKFTKTSPDGKYQDFIDGLMKRQKAEQPAATAPAQVPDKSNITIAPLSPNDTVSVKLQSDPINEKSTFGHIFDNARIITEDGKSTVNFELDGMIIDRDARKISESKDGQSYELNIGWKGDNVLIDKVALKNAIDNGKGYVDGTTLPKNGTGEPVKIIINKEPISDADKGKIGGYVVSNMAANSPELNLNIQTGDASKNADSANKVPSPALNIQMNNVTSTIPEMTSDIVATIEASTTIQQANSAIPESEAIVA